MPKFLSASAVCTPIIYLGFISALAINDPHCDAGLYLEARVPFPSDVPPEESSPPVRTRPSVPPATEPPPSPKSDNVGAQPKVIDEGCLKRAIDTVNAKYTFDAKAFTEKNRAKAQADYDRARAQRQAARSSTNSAGKGNQGGESLPPLKMGKVETWADRMTVEVKAEGSSSYEASVKRGQPLPLAGHALNGPQLNAVIKQYRGKITDTRLMGLIDQITKEYQTEVAKAALNAAKPQSEVGNSKPNP